VGCNFLPLLALGGNMAEIKETVSHEIDWIQRTATLIIQKTNPEELDLIPVAIERYYQEQEKRDVSSDDKPFAFTEKFTDNPFLIYSVFWLLENIVKPFITKSVDYAIEQTAKNSIDELAKKIQSIIKKKPKSSNKQNSDQIDILVPINWQALNKKIIVAGKSISLSKKDAKIIANQTVKELSENQVLIGDLILNVYRNKINPDSK
jgi:hypothetical protein